MEIAVIGLGYVGLVTSGCLAHLGHHVTGVEISDERLSSLSRGTVPFHEPGLDEMVAEGLRAGRLRFTASAADAVAEADIVIVAVGTHDGHGGWQTFTLLSAVREVARAMPDSSVLVIRSTMPPAFGERVATTARQARGEAGCAPVPVLVNPEFTKEGSAVHDYLQPDRVVIGVIDDPDGSGTAVLKRLYEPFGAPVLVMPGVDATLAKLAANLFLATKISFANELASLCDAFGADVSKVTASMGHDARIGPSFLRAGVGFGGSCLPHQVSMTARTAGEVGLELPLIEAVEGVNQRQRDRFVHRLDLLADGLEGRRIALLGLAFKPETDDLRDAPSLEIARQLIEAGATVVAYDPMERAREGAVRAVPGLIAASSAAEALEGADAVGLVTEWSEFIGLDWAALGSTMARRAIVDGRNALDPATMEKAGFQMLSYGRRPVGPVPERAFPVAPVAAESLSTAASAGG
jgi:UDPglucose 6-dehydrogenase